MLNPSTQKLNSQTENLIIHPQPNLTSQKTALRDYQEAQIQGVYEAWRGGSRRVMMQSATGTGKTVTFSHIASEFTSRGERVLVVAHREELLTQAQEKLVIASGLPVGIIKAGYGAIPTAPIQVASIQTLVRRKLSLNPALIVVDEAHHAAARSYRSLIEGYPNAYVLGVTATPCRGDGHGFKLLFDKLILGATVPGLIAKGYLSKFRLFAAHKAINTEGVKAIGGDFNQRELAAAVDNSLVMGDLVDTWRKHAEGKRTVVFAVNIAHSQEIAQAYTEAGISAEHLDGETPADERKAILERFRTGQTLILSNCGIVTEGLDIPGIEAIQCVRPTKSLVFWLQAIGRALRPAPGKEYAIIIDHTKNWLVHGLPDEDREWSLDPVSLSPKEKWTARCQGCEHVFRALPHEQKSLKASCPSCGCEIELKASGKGDRKEIFTPQIIGHDAAAKVEEINTELNPAIVTAIQALKAEQERYGRKLIWVYYQIIKDFPDIGLIELRELARVLGYKPGWAWHKYQELQILGGVV